MASSRKRGHYVAQVTFPVTFPVATSSYWCTSPRNAYFLSIQNNRSQTFDRSFSTGPVPFNAHGQGADRYGR
eukprot:3809288-Prymnesium_polylepis.1